MSDKKKIIDLITDKNIYLKDRSLRKHNLEGNKEVTKLAEQFSKIDSIENVDELRRNVKKRIPSNRMLTYGIIGAESLFYGHFNSIVEYAGLKLDKPISLPNIEHGVSFFESKMLRSKINSVPSFIFASEYKKNMIHRRNPLKPVFGIGPYIHYAENYYSDVKLQQMKERLGKTLLVFPSHTYELSKQNYDVEKFVDYIYNIGRDFDTILVNSYWADLDSPVIDMFKARGAKIVSAGIRLDPKFLSRLKSIITLSDMVIGNNIGTHIGYCIHLKKPFKLIDSQIETRDMYTFTEEDKDRYQYNYNHFMKAFHYGNDNLANSLYEYFWGGDILIKTRNEMKNIVLLSDKILKFSLGNERSYDESIKKIYKKLSSPNSEDEVIQYQILKKAIKI